MKILSIYDAVAERYGNPFVSPNLAVADRDFALACKEPKSPMGMFPKDISLVYIGEFNENTGEIKPVKPLLIAKAINYLPEDIKEKVKNTPSKTQIFTDPRVQEAKKQKGE